ncbi:MAG: hypothetical protein AB1444_12845 [Spirochaetota bacterium]
MNHDSITIIGGARIGCINVTFPFAKLTISKDMLNLKVMLLGNYSFKRGDIISVERYGLIPFFSWGIRINHTRNNYPQKMIFWTFGKNPVKLIEKICTMGFIDSDVKNSVNDKIKIDGIPVKIIPLAIIIIVWNILLLLDFVYIFDKQKTGPGIFSFLALICIFIIATSLKCTNSVKKIILKSNRHYSEIQHINNLLILVSGFMMVLYILKYILKF